MQVKIILIILATEVSITLNKYIILLKGLGLGKHYLLVCRWSKAMATEETPNKAAVKNIGQWKKFWPS